MLKTIQSALLASLLLLANLAWADGDALLGQWATPDDRAVIEIYKQDGAYFGKFVYLQEPLYPAGHESGLAGQPKIDRNNPDESKRSRTIMGMNLLQDFVYKGKNTWHQGRIYDPEQGKVYKCTIKLKQDGTLKVRGYIGVSLFGRTQIWRPYNAN